MEYKDAIFVSYIVVLIFLFFLFAICLKKSPIMSMRFVLLILSKRFVLNYEMMTNNKCGNTGIDINCATCYYLRMTRFL